ncbi:MAG: alpha/beta hydrolase [Terriglobia bacterium]
MAAPRYGPRRERGLLVAAGRVLNDIRYPTTVRAKIIAGTLATIVFSFLTLLVLGVFFLSRVLNPVQAGETIDPTTLLATAQTVEFQAQDGQTRRGWFFPGLRGAPVVVICHGYKSSRSEVLTLATSLQQHRYNVFAFNQAGHGESPVGSTSLGYRETQELLAALEMLRQRTDIDTNRMGLWGHSLGAYAVLNVAPQVPQVKAIVLDSVYPRPKALLRLELNRSGANLIPLLMSVTTLEFRLVSAFYGKQSEAADDLDRLAGLPKLFLAGDDSPELSAMTKQLYNRTPGPKELVVLPRTKTSALFEEERRSYENRIVSFYLENLPLVGRAR